MVAIFTNMIMFNMLNHATRHKANKKGLAALSADLSLAAWSTDK